MKKESLIHKILRKLGFIKDIEDDRKPSEISKKDQRTDKKRGSSRARHEGGKTARS